MSLVNPSSETKPQVSPPAAKALPPAPKSVQLTAMDREFLPASLEILVTPPSPIAGSLLLTICGLFFLPLAWSYFGWIDIYAVPPGKFQPIGGSKVVQPLEPGIVTAIYVKKGRHLNPGGGMLGTH